MASRSCKTSLEFLKVLLSYRKMHNIFIRRL
jgi:hypothetical protein